MWRHADSWDAPYVDGDRLRATFTGIGHAGTYVGILASMYNACVDMEAGEVHGETAQGIELLFIASVGQVQRDREMLAVAEGWNVRNADDHLKMAAAGVCCPGHALTRITEELHELYEAERARAESGT
jgi:hypothetical protein